MPSARAFNFTVRVVRRIATPIRSGDAPLVAKSRNLWTSASVQLRFSRRIQVF
jgi:hypothetical protein